jgi:hypothetical protein
MAQVNTDFVEQTVTFWQPRTSRKLTREDGVQIVENVTAFFRILLEWETADRNAAIAAAEQELIAPPVAARGLE